jgi:membrane protein insertase Oxa1/YidC/SpoIIIJ
MKLLQPPKPPAKLNADGVAEEDPTAGVLKFLPFLVGFFSLNVPSGLGIYWIVNNVLTTLLTVQIKSNFKKPAAAAGPGAVPDNLSSGASSFMNSSSNGGGSIDEEALRVMKQVDDSSSNSSSNSAAEDELVNSGKGFARNRSSADSK